MKVEPTDERASKRTRRDAESEPNVNPVRSADLRLWLDDGNLILQAHSGARSVLYKVHKSTLRLNSAFFRTLFDDSRDALDAGFDIYGGLPVFKMADDAEDVKLFLEALYFPATTQSHLTQLQTVGRVYRFPESYAPILRLATKYDCSILRETVSTVLRMEWPSTLLEHDKLVKTLITLTEAKAMANKWSDYTSTLREHSPSIIRLAHDCNVPDVLPACYYEVVCALEVGDVDLSDLTADELTNVINGRRRLRDWFFIRTTERLDRLKQPKPTCARAMRGASAWPCQPVLEKLWSGCFPKSMKDACRAFFPLRFLDVRYHAVEGNVGVCPACLAWLLAAVQDIRQDIWQKMPNFFGLESLVPLDWGKHEHTT
ncbi:hypothetical protein OF83DRAFT_697126 [Amylostereum chailletii]|nr:hypothetical protein OF83DRAFT_697126 [Amylostereum chailletii]